VHITQALDELGDGHARFYLGFEAAVKQFTFERGEETLAHCVIEAIAAGAIRGSHAGRAAARAEGERSVLATLVRMMNHGIGPALPERQLSACSTSSVRRWVAIAQPTLLRLNVSSTTAR
jgi:hypothetical protein